VLVEFRASPIDGKGGFAIASIPAGAKVIEYLGEKIDKFESLRRCEANNPFIFYLNEQENLDGNVAWNPARWLNHGCAPNCETELIEGRIWVVAKRFIAAGEELTFDYGYDLEQYREYPCRCGAPNCVGYILAEAFRGQVGPA